MRQALNLKLELESFLDVKWVSSFWRTSKWALAPVRLRRRGRHSPENMRVRNGEQDVPARYSTKGLSETT